MLVHVFDCALRLLHPIVPFVTESLWQRLPGGTTGEFLIRASWPRRQPRPERPRSDDFERVREVVLAVRQIRGDYGVAPGKTIDVAEHPDADLATNGLGTVHHVAMAIGTADEQLAIREELIRYGCKVTEVRDRCYFTSIYFREPGGVLFEIATIAPGFAIDEALPDLGRGLKLPPWEEPHRADIESTLTPVTY